MKGRFVTIGWFTEPWDAHIARGRLEAEGIPAFVFHEQHIWANWMYSFVLGRVKLQVFSDDEASATDVLRRHVEGEFALVDEEGQGEHCPVCGSERLIRRVGVVSTVLVFAVYTFLGLAYPPGKNIVVCQSCGHKQRRDDY